MIHLRPYEDLAAMAVFQALDPADLAECDQMRGAVTMPLALFAEWRGIEAARVVSLIASTAGGTPFAVFGLCNTGQAGVAAAALLARSHRTYRRELAALARQIRSRLAPFCTQAGIRRIEARSWAGHPTASRLLQSLGFSAECTMPGFGPTGQATFVQFARTFPTPACATASEVRPCA